MILFILDSQLTCFSIERESREKDVKTLLLNWKHFGSFLYHEIVGYVSIRDNSFTWLSNTSTDGDIVALASINAFIITAAKG